MDLASIDNFIRIIYYFSINLKVEALNNDSDNLDDRIVIYMINNLAYSLAYR